MSSIKGRFKFGNVVRIQIVFERGNRGTFKNDFGALVFLPLNLTNESCLCLPVFHVDFAHRHHNLDAVPRTVVGS